MAYTIYCDGLCEPAYPGGPRNPGGMATYGFVIYKDHEQIKEGWAIIGSGQGMTNNVAEYTGAIKALEWMIENDLTDDKITLRSDSQLLIYQLDGSYAVRSPRIYPLYSHVRKLLKKFKKKSYCWIPREENEEADALSRRAYYSRMEKSRKERAKELVPLVEKIEDGYKIKDYFIPEDLSNCSCPDYGMRCQKYEIRCKHILAVEMSKNP